MDVSQLIKQRLNELGLDQKGLAAAAQVTESYVSQLLARKKAPPSPRKTEIYERIGEFLGLPAGELTKLAELQRQEELKKKVADPLGPLHETSRDLLLRTCENARRREVQRIFEKDPFGEFERLITQTFLALAQEMVKEQMRRDGAGYTAEDWIRGLAGRTTQCFEECRTAILEFLASDIFTASVENAVPLLEVLIRTWDIDLKTFALEAVVSPSFGHFDADAVKRFEFVERERDPSSAVETGFEQFLRDERLSAGVTEEEIEFLKSLRFGGRRRPSPIFYYRALQNLRDPLHFTICASDRV